MTAERLTHAAARERWGLPDAQEGSVNDPRTLEENGVRHNEKWIYHLPDGQPKFDTRPNPDVDYLNISIVTAKPR